MRAAVLTGERTFDVETRERPSPAPDEVLVAIRHVGLCGSDLHYYAHGRNGDNVLETPTVMGHESAGEVVAVGDGVTDLAAGDRVALEPGIPCGDCPHCDRGDYHLCPDVTFMASPPDDGALAEYVAWPAAYAHRLPDGVSTRAGALCEPLSVGVHATRRGDVGPEDTVLVSGCGPVGLLVTVAAVAAGADRVVAADVVPRKLDLASAHGADRVVDARETDVVDAVREETGGLGADVVFECSGARPSVEATVRAVRRGGRVVHVGLPEEPSLPTDVLGLVDGELDIRGSYRFSHTYPRAVELFASGAVDVDALVDFEMPLADTAEAFERALDPEVVKGVVTPT